MLGKGVNWVVICPTATPRSSTTLVRSARVGAAPLAIVDGPGVGVFLPELPGCAMASTYDCSDSDSVSDGASHAAAASRSSINLCCAPADFVSQSSW